MDRGMMIGRAGRAILLIALASSAAPAAATSLSGVPVQVNLPPTTGYYEYSTSHVVDMSTTAFAIVWKEDRVNDLGRLEGEKILLRVFGTTAATPVQLKAAVQLDLPAENGSKTLLGGRRRANGTVDVFWTIGTPSTARFRLVQQPFVALVKSGGPLTRFSDTLGAFRSPRLINLLTGRSLFLWNTSGVTAGRFLAQTGGLGAAFTFPKPAGESLLQTAPTTQGFAASTAKYNSTFTTSETYGHSYDANGNLLAAKTLLIPSKPVGDVTTAMLVRRSDDTVVYLHAIKNAAGKTDVFGRAYGPSWAPLTASVKIVSALPADWSGPSATPLANGELLIAQEKPVGSQKVIEYIRLDRNLQPIGTAARIGPFPLLNSRGIKLLSGGRAVATFDKGTSARYIQFITP